MYQLNNGILSVGISARGAELRSILRKADQHEYMWSGDPAFWGKTSPVLFPIVGGLQDNSYQYKGEKYSLPRHGFARDREFIVTAQTPESITLTLISDEDTLAVYPFAFRFSISYTLQGSSISVRYEVINTGDKDMFFSVGAHPAFAVPLEKGLAFADHYLVFSNKESAKKWPLSKEGLIKEEADPFFSNTDRLPLTKELFYGDALVFKDLRSNSISIGSDKTQYGLTVSYQDFPYMGIWSARNADFVCIEPWCGIADSTNASGNIEEKEGINILAPKTCFERTWGIHVK